MVVYGITLVTLAEELCASAPDLLAPLYAHDAAFNGTAYRSARLLKLILERGLARGYFPVLEKSLFICDSSAQEEAAKRVFTA